MTKIVISPNLSQMLLIWSYLTPLNRHRWFQKWHQIWPDMTCMTSRGHLTYKISIFYVNLLKSGRQDDKFGLKCQTMLLYEAYNIKRGYQCQSSVKVMLGQARSLKWCTELCIEVGIFFVCFRSCSDRLFWMQYDHTMSGKIRIFFSKPISTT